MKEINTKEEFNEYMKKNKYEVRKYQYEFYARTLDFMKSDVKFLINPAGMGLGKTFPTTTIINQYLEDYDLILVVNPTSPLKYIWIKNIQQVGLLNKTAIWPSKRDVCIHKQILKDRDFPLSKCNDDCPCQKNCKKGEMYTEEARRVLEEYMSLGEKATPLNYYEKVIQERNIDIENLNEIEEVPFNCLYAPTRMGLRDLYNPGTRKIIVGDYYGFLIPQMFKDVTEIDLSKLRLAGSRCLLIIDEGHLLNSRAIGHYSNYIYLNRGIYNLEMELEKYKGDIKPTTHRNILFIIKRFKELEEKLNYKLVKINDKIEYNFDDLRSDIINNKQILNDLIKSLVDLNEVINQKKDKEEQKSTALNFAEYLRSLRDNSNTVDYTSEALKDTHYKIEDIRLDCMCIDPHNNLKRLFRNWNKVIINTGTLPKSKKIVLHEIGIDKEDCIYGDLLKSYDLSNYTFILPEGEFKKTERNKTYIGNIKKMPEILNKMSGKTMIFIQSKSDSLLLEKLLNKYKFKIINFCEKEDESEEVTSEEFEQLKNKFTNYKGKCIGMININGRVEGHNFTDDDSIPQVSNVIIYGFPMPYVNDLMKKREKLYITKGFGNEQLILNHIHLTGPIQKIQQACYRCKREEKQNPIIILWGERFTDNENWIYKSEIYKSVKGEYNIFNSLPKDFKKNVGDYNNLIKFIEKREDGRINNIH